MKLQAKDIPEDHILSVIDAVSGPYGVSLWHIQDPLKERYGYPPKVVLARLRSMVNRGILSAQCTCGCKGPYSRPEVFCWYPEKTAKARARQLGGVHSGHNQTT